LTNGHSEIHENSLEDPGVIDTESETKNVEKCIFIEVIIYSNGKWLYAYHSLLIFEALGLSLHSLLVNPALSVHNLRVSPQKLISQHTLCQWRTQKIFIGGFGSRSYGGHLHLVCAVCDVTIGRHFHVSKPTFWRSLL